MERNLLEHTGLYYCDRCENRKLITYNEVSPPVRCEDCGEDLEEVEREVIV